MACVPEAKAATILEFIQGLGGTLALTFEEGSSAAWLHDLLKPQPTLRSSEVMSVVEKIQPQLRLGQVGRLSVLVACIALAQGS